MSFRDDSEDGRDLRKPFLHTGSWYRMGSRQSSLMGSSQAFMTTPSLYLPVFSSLLWVLSSLASREGIHHRPNSQLLGTLGLLSRSNVGAMVGAITSGQLAEYIGRKGALMIAAIPNIIGWLTISFAKDSSFLYMGRLLEGFGVGIISYTVPVYIAEIAPQNLRGSLGSVKSGVLPCTILIPGLFFIPESPRWLAKMGMTEEFETSLQVLRGFDTDITVEVNEIKIGIGLLILQQLSGINGVLFYSSTIFASAGITSSNAATFGLGAVQDAAVPPVSEDSSFFVLVYRESWTVVGVVAMVVTFSLWVLEQFHGFIMSEILPVNIKGLAGSIATLANWFSAWGVTMSANLLLEWSSGGWFELKLPDMLLAIVYVKSMLELRQNGITFNARRVKWQQEERFGSM
ncbi:Sugar transporter ERD6-like 6, partial [Cucurbita argyrosperma subsp. sororia]